ncbi:MAG: protease complex subunit PrcB family protein [Elusimicrobiota bacterium]
MSRLRAGVFLCAAAALLTAMARTPAEKEQGTMNDPSGLIVVDVSPSTWEGANCSIAAAGERVIRDEEAWKALWREAFGADAPPVDFKKYFAAAVFLGVRNTGGYGVEFLPPAAAGQAIALPYRAAAPASSSFVIQAFTQPYAIRLYRAADAPVKLRRVN